MRVSPTRGTQQGTGSIYIPLVKLREHLGLKRARSFGNMKSYSADYSLLALLVLSSSCATAVSAQCRVGDMMLVEGQTTGFLGHTCTGESAFAGVEGVCASDGTVSSPRHFESLSLSLTDDVLCCRLPCSITRHDA